MSIKLYASVVCSANKATVNSVPARRERRPVRATESGPRRSAINPSLAHPSSSVAPKASQKVSGESSDSCWKRNMRQSACDQWKPDMPMSTSVMPWHQPVSFAGTFAGAAHCGAHVRHVLSGSAGSLVAGSVHWAASPQLRPAVDMHRIQQWMVPSAQSVDPSEAPPSSDAPPAQPAGSSTPKPCSTSRDALAASPCSCRAVSHTSAALSPAATRSACATCDARHAP
eukprot:4569223-Prymnesium_polylepis.2